MPERVVAGRRLINATAADIFAVLADPAEHGAIDGSGLIRGTHGSAVPRLALATVFEMRMQQAGSRYRIANEVVEFAEPYVIAWQVHATGRFTRVREFLAGGHRWRYRLSETADGTLVDEEWDYSRARSPWFLAALRFPGRNAAAIERTLDNLQARFA